MTALPPTVPDPQTTRPSKAILAIGHTESILNQIGAKVFALLCCAAFGHWTFLEIKSATPSNFRLGLFAVPTFFFAAMVMTDPVVNTIKALGGALAPYLPAKFGGKS